VHFLAAAITVSPFAFVSAFSASFWLRTGNVDGHAEFEDGADSSRLGFFPVNPCCKPKFFSCQSLLAAMSAFSASFWLRTGNVDGHAEFEDGADSSRLGFFPVNPCCKPRFFSCQSFLSILAGRID
jgi:hypothetical protein